MALYPSMYVYHTVNIQRRAPLCPGDNNLFFIFLFLFANLQGRVGQREVRVPAVKLCDRRFPLRLEALLRPQRARRGRLKVWKEIDKP
jgi:hypothetical protein